MNTNDRDPLLYRDGTAQSQRQPKAMTPDYVAVEERTITEVFTFIQNYAKELYFYDLTDTPVGDWSSFFNQDIDDIIAFVQDPSVFDDDKEKEIQLSQPHLVLLLTFLQLLEYQKEQVNTLTKAHLDFYYSEALQMTKKAAVPDQVNVTIQLDSRNGTYELKAGTLFYAGRDSNGNDLLYESDTDTLINHAEISQIKTLYNDKEVITLRDPKLREGDIMELMELAVGDPNPGDPLPPYPPGINSLQDVVDQWESTDQAIIDDSIEEAVVNLMKENIFIAQERQINTAFKGVLNTTITDNLVASGETLNTDWGGIIANIINNPDKQAFGELMMAILYPEDSTSPAMEPEALGRDLLLIMEKNQDVLFDLLSDTLEQILTADLDETTKTSLTDAIDQVTTPDGSILENDILADTDREILNRVLNEAVAKADAQSNEAPLYETVAAALYANNNAVSQDTYTQAVVNVLGESTKKKLNAAIRAGIDEQAGKTQEKIVDDGIAEYETAIEEAITSSSERDPQGIATNLESVVTDAITDATTGLLTGDTKNLISLSVQLKTEKDTLKTIGRQGIADAAETALANMSLSQQTIYNVTEDIQLGIVNEEVTGMPDTEGEREPVVKDIIDQALAKVTQQTLTNEEEDTLIAAILVAVDQAKLDVEAAIAAVIDNSSNVVDVTVATEAEENTDEALVEVITIAKDTSESAAEDYGLNQLFMEKEELDYVLQDRTSSDNEAWEQCYVILEDAHYDKVVAQGKETLQYKREEGDKIAEGRGFQDISEYCWGQPGEEDPLPPYPEGSDNLDDVYGQLLIGTEEEQQNASDYIRDKLYLTEDDFSQVMQVKNDPRATEEEWDNVYGLMEVARMQNRGIVVEEPQKEDSGNLYATPDAPQTAFRKEYEDETTELRWKTFGSNQLDEKNDTVTFADIGFAISSSVLAMEKGKRKMTWTMAFEEQSFKQEDMEDMFAKGTTSESEEFPFAFAVTTPKQWVEVQVKNTCYGTCLTRDPEKVYDAASSGLSSSNVVTKLGGDAFVSADVGGFLVWGADKATDGTNEVYITSGTIYRIDTVISGDEVKVTPLTDHLPEDQRPATHLLKKYGSEDIYFQALQFELSVDEKEDPIAVLEEATGTFQWPALKMLLRNIRHTASIEGEPDYYTNYYNLVEDLKLEKACVKVSVEELSDFSVSNDSSILKSSGPFEPFGSNPEAGSACYFAHTETAYKKLDTLHIDIEWMGAPDDFKTHYENYWRVGGIVDYPYMDNAGYTAQLRLNDRSLGIALESSDYTETFVVREGGLGELFLLSGKPATTATKAHFTVKAEDGTLLPVNTYEPDQKSKYLVINTEGRPIGDSFTVTYGNTESEPEPEPEPDSSETAEANPPTETLEVHKIGDRVTFYLKYGMDGNKEREISEIKWDTGQEEDITPEDSGVYSSAKITIDTNSQAIGSKIKVTYPASGNPYLFSSPDATNKHQLCIRNVSEVLAQSNAGYTYARDNSLYTNDDVREWARFWEFNLNPPDFYTKDYSRLLSKQQLAGYEEVKELLLNAPYTPEIKKMTFAYTALAAVEVKTYASGGDDDLLLYVHPFGYSEIYPSEETGDNEEEIYYFFPDYKDEGHLYIGFDKLETPNNLSVLFQMAEGSADPDLPKAQVQWSYLSNNLWVTLGEESIPYDQTNGLVNTGIIYFVLPEEATNNNTLLPQGLHWLRATVDLNAAAVCDTIDIQAQAIKAVLANPDEVPPDHLTQLLPAGSITKTAGKIEEVEKVNQPYTSDKGKPKEQDNDYYLRVGERIRHKNRLLTLWDYERMVLEKFPDVYKAKCLFTNDKTNTEGELGQVTVLVIPDIKGKLPFDPFEPKVPTAQLLQIHEYLTGYMPQAVSLVVRNANFTPIKVRFAVRFLKGYNEGIYKEQISEDLKQYLSPWAYDEGAEIAFGSKIYPNSIIDFLEGRYYVDYITRIKIFQETTDENGDAQWTDVRLLQDGDSVAVATMPDEILMSATEHEVDVITTSQYDDTIYRGINYMKIELDFIVETRT